MGLKAPPSQRHDVQILTTHFQFTGQLETVGPAGNFINDPARQSLSFYDVQLSPLTPGSPLKGISRPHVVIMKSQIVLLYLASEESRASISTFQRQEQLMIYTPVAVCRGHFPMPSEARIGDFLGVVPGDLLPIIDAHIFPFVELSIPFVREAELLLLGRSNLLFYHPV
ncbi:MAG: hypothetical protein GY832_27210 [Chloroflexi bacterium]|nr:hypothetical protein [Chloroflexota bacterium]